MDAGVEKKSRWISISDFMISWKLFLIVYVVYFGMLFLDVFLVLLPSMTGGEGQWQVSGDLLGLIDVIYMLLPLLFWPTSLLALLVRRRWKMLVLRLFLAAILFVPYALLPFWPLQLGCEHGIARNSLGSVYSPKRDKTYFVAVQPGFDGDEAFIRIGHHGRFSLVWDIEQNSRLGYEMLTRVYDPSLLSLKDPAVILTPDEKLLAVYRYGLFQDLVDLDTGEDLADDVHMSDRDGDCEQLKRSSRIKEILQDHGWSEICPK